MTQMSADNDPKDPQTYAVIGAAMHVHTRLGHGFLEAVYHEAMCIEMEECGIPFKREVPLAVHYRGRQLQCGYRADLICFEDVMVELKALGKLTGAEEAQVINYLKATGYNRGLLLNFGAPRLEYRRLVWSHHLRSSASSADTPAVEGPRHE